MPGIFWIVPAAGIAAIIFAIILARDVLKRSQGTPEMARIGGMIFEGAWAFLKRQYTTIGWLSIIVAVVVGALVGVLGGHRGIEGITAFGIAWRTAIAFMAGAFCSAISGFIGMYIAVKSNARCASASQSSLKEAVNVALRGGAVPGFLIVALSLLGVAVIFFAYGGASTPNIAPHLIVGFGFGASFVALFAQLGGGIYTKAADMGADLVGKVEAGIPEDDPRNAAVIADLVGDNVGDCAGRGADLFESTAAENIGAMILGITIYAITGNVAWVLFPLVVRAFGIIASMIGIICVRIRGEENPMNALNRGYYVAVGLSIIGMLITVQVMLNNWWQVRLVSWSAWLLFTSPSTIPRDGSVPSGLSSRLPRQGQRLISSPAPPLALRRHWRQRLLSASPCCSLTGWAPSPGLKAPVPSARL
jgi:K(+)-stimulated pyrophosphate-energized sodium pump